jgi:sterol-4alpha-carboxylate 3-dehydrogenase (decarboxylating)
MPLPPPTIPLGTVLVVGGCGFLGHHIVRELLNDPSCTAVAVMSRDPSMNRYEGVTYLTGDIVSRADVERIINQVKPNVIINTASPIAYLDYEHAPQNFKVNVDGNRHLISCANAIGTVKAFVYTSSAPIVAGSGGAYSRADETVPTLAVLRKGDPYHLAKALGDQLVLDANNPHGMRTCTIRPTAMYGEGDRQMIGHTLNVLEKKQTNVWLGYNDVLMDVVYVEHVARAHLLAAHGLLKGINDPNAPKVDGEAFNITDDKPMEPWTFFRKIWVAAGDKTPLSSIWYIPPWLTLLMIAIAEWFTWIISFGTRRPKLLTKERIEFVLYTRTYSIKKARERLGYSPFMEVSEALRRAVNAALKERSGAIAGMKIS